MSESKPQIERYVPVWGISLLFLGVVFLLQTFSVLPWSLWGTLWRFWPVLIIIAGLNILMRRYNIWLVSSVILALLLACLGIAIWQHGLPAGETTKSYSESLDDLRLAHIQVDFNAGNLVMGSLPAGSLNLIEADSTVKNGDMRVDFQRQDGEGTLNLRTERVGWQSWDEAESRWEVMLNRSIPLTMEVKSAVGNLELDLKELDVNDLQMDLDAGNCILKMPASAGITHAYIKADVANLEIVIPDGVAARLEVDTELSAFEMDESRFPKVGDYYVSSDFETAENRIELELDCDIGRVRVE